MSAILMRQTMICFLQWIWQGYWEIATRLKRRQLKAIVYLMCLGRPKGPMLAKNIMSPMSMLVLEPRLEGKSLYDIRPSRVKPYTLMSWQQDMWGLMLRSRSKNLKTTSIKVEKNILLVSLTKKEHRSSFSYTQLKNIRRKKVAGGMRMQSMSMKMAKSLSQVSILMDDQAHPMNSIH